MFKLKYPQQHINKTFDQIQLFQNTSYSNLRLSASHISPYSLIIFLGIKIICKCTQQQTENVRVVNFTIPSSHYHYTLCQQHSPALKRLKTHHSCTPTHKYIYTSIYNVCFINAHNILMQKCSVQRRAARQHNKNSTSTDEGE